MLGSLYLLGCVFCRSIYTYLYFNIGIWAFAQKRKTKVDLLFVVQNKAVPVIANIDWQFWFPFTNITPNFFDENKIKKVSTFRENQGSKVMSLKQWKNHI